MATIYVDELRDYPPKGKFCHMWTPDGTDKDLDAFARMLGLKRSWAHTSHGLVGRFYHYDLTPNKRRQALEFNLVVKEVKLADWIKEVTNNFGHGTEVK